jgi:hypothetical protein
MWHDSGRDDDIPARPDRPLVRAAPELTRPLLLPGIGHQVTGSPVTESVLEHQVRFLRRHLGTASSWPAPPEAEPLQ